MEKRRLFHLMILLAILFLVAAGTNRASASSGEADQAHRKLTSDQAVTPTQLPTQEPSPEATDTPAARVLPRLGGNAGVVLGASVLVLIIIGGVVLSSRRRSKH